MLVFGKTRRERSRFWRTRLLINLQYGRDGAYLIGLLSEKARNKRRPRSRSLLSLYLIPLPSTTTTAICLALLSMASACRPIRETCEELPVRLFATSRSLDNCTSVHLSSPHQEELTFTGFLECIDQLTNVEV